jgi:small subunit ribosomal protein S11
MGKKHVATQNSDELLKERDTVEAKVNKDVQVKAATRLREGRIYISSSYNNTIVSLTNENGDLIYQRSAGSIGFKGTKKGTPFAASKVAEAVAEVLKKMSIERAQVFVKGIGSGRDSAVRSLASRGIDIVSIKDITPSPHNGCRPRKVRRV